MLNRLSTIEGIHATIVALNVRVQQVARFFTMKLLIEKLTIISATMSGCRHQIQKVSKPWFSALIICAALWVSLRVLPSNQAFDCCCFRRC